MTGHRLLQIQPARSWWIASCLCGWTSDLAETRDRAAWLLEMHCLDATLGGHTDPKAKGPAERPA